MTPVWFSGVPANPPKRPDSPLRAAQLPDIQRTHVRQAAERQACPPCLLGAPGPPEQQQAQSGVGPARHRILILRRIQPIIGPCRPANRGLGQAGGQTLRVQPKIPVKAQASRLFPDPACKLFHPGADHGLCVRGARSGGFLSLRHVPTGTDRSAACPGQRLDVKRLSGRKAVDVLVNGSPAPQRTQPRHLDRHRCDIASGCAEDPGREDRHCHATNLDRNLLGKTG